MARTCRADVIDLETRRPRACRNARMRGSSYCYLADGSSERFDPTHVSHPEWYTDARAPQAPLNAVASSVAGIAELLDADGGQSAALRSEARRLRVDVDKTLDSAHDLENVAWSTNDWCFSRPNPIVAADAVIVRHGADGSAGDEVLLIKRKRPPFASCWALPGGMREAGESFGQAAEREAGEEVHLQSSQVVERRALGEVISADWDTRSPGPHHIGAVTFIVEDGADVSADSDAASSEWVPVAQIADGSYPLAFDHAWWLAKEYEGDPELGPKLELLHRASLERNVRLIRQINEVRAAQGQPLIDLSPEREVVGP